MIGIAHVFGDDINTDILAPGLYMKSSLDILASHCLDVIAPEFAASVKVGDILVAGDMLGVGSSREQAVEVLQYLGIRALVAKSFAGIFYRNALNFGITAVSCAEAGQIRAGDRIGVDAIAGRITNHSRAQTYRCDVLPDQLLKMVQDGGLIAHLEKTMAQNPKKDIPI